MVMKVTDNEAVKKPEAVNNIQIANGQSTSKEISRSGKKSEMKSIINILNLSPTVYKFMKCTVYKYTYFTHVTDFR